jgi:hypothetical protein
MVVVFVVVVVVGGCVVVVVAVKAEVREEEMMERDTGTGRLISLLVRGWRQQSSQQRDG